MEKLGILLDSFSGISKKKINKLGFEFIAQIIEMNGKIYKDGENIYAKDIVNIINDIKDFKTSLPPIGKIVSLYKKMSKKYENIIFITTPNGLSSTFSVAKAAANEFKKIHVISTRLVSWGIIEVAQRSIEKMNKGQDISSVLKYIKNFSNNSFSYVIPKNVERIISSGRLTGFKKLIMKKAKLIPKLFVTANNGFEVKGIARNFSKTCKAIVAKIIEEIGGIEKIKKYYWGIVTTGDAITEKLAKNGIIENLIKEIKISYASVGVLMHAGVGTVGIAAWPKK